LLGVAGAETTKSTPWKNPAATTRERLLNFVSADQPKRAACLEQALLIAQRQSLQVERAIAVSWLAERLAAPQQAGVCRVLFHSMMLQYYSQPIVRPSLR